MTYRIGAAISVIPKQGNNRSLFLGENQSTLTIAGVRMIDAIRHEDVQQFLPREISFILEESHGTIRPGDVFLD